MREVAGADVVTGEVAGADVVSSQGLPGVGTVPPHVVQAIARHADVKLTLKIYSHTNLDAMRDALGKLDRRLS